MNLEFTNGNAIVFQGIAFVPFKDGRFGKTEFIWIPFHRFSKIRIEYFQANAKIP